MSIYYTSSPKHCEQQQGLKSKKINKRVLCILSSILTFILTFFLLIYILLRPSNPQFYLKDVGVYHLSLSSSPNLLNSTIQFTLVSKNPNNRIGVYYDSLLTYAAYKDQRITTNTRLPPFYQGHQDANLLSAFLYGAAVPVASSFGNEVGHDRTVGRFLVKIKLDGTIRWKLGSWVSSRYHVDVDCVAVMGFGHGSTSTPSPISSMRGAQCSTNI